ncbi:hypothetical protein MBM_09445 [Drepanopeziza brunnea f. sp. 'multigermtubi' MB_m1]|uniref:DUF8004 domain-containing protein n=1 Tax=Marssonina brunnea f. sp. multigermtubi (strain MB_m1) TaxID=1072389 RepID=K1WHR2_MARBU|nr:uncharacterized protein MBM_09445 [Drepanopeziza brunnea f. sp. 'multigermtubi' MB_m1]EKD12411.1 hypothetical protein MBM_09445 [Drepanopeziza brunnea f. sp. 'multigermtubi' MB_m1]
MNLRKWDGAAGRSTDWDGLRRVQDPDLWYEDGNCLVYLYERGQSRRGPAFKIPMDALLQAKCQPLLDRFLAGTLQGSPSSKTSNVICSNQDRDRVYELYIPAPPYVDREEAFLYHTATRNFFAWIFRRFLVGVHLGGALVGLLNSMNQFRSTGEDNTQGIIDYMNEEGYSDMRNTPDHALGVIYLAEQFRLRDLWLDAFAHCAGMHEKLIISPGFEFMARKTRALITRSRFEMDARLDQYGTRLSSFLWDELSDAHLGFSSAARAHLNKFRSFLHSYHKEKLGCYPPACEYGRTSFPKHIYAQMCTEFQNLYEYLVDKSRRPADSITLIQRGGVCVLQSVQAFDQRNKYQPLDYPLPLLPKSGDKSGPPLKRRYTIAARGDKMKSNPRLVTLAHLVIATNGQDQAVLDCTLVRAYKGFEEHCVFYPTKGDRNEKLSQTDARKVRWILIYSILQTLLSATLAPREVRDTHNVPYNICVITAGCPPWKVHPHEASFRSQAIQTKVDFKAVIKQSPTERIAPTLSEVKPDIDCFAITHARQNSACSSPMSSSSKGTIQTALGTLGNMPELYPTNPQRALYHETLVHVYGNNTLASTHTSSVSINAARAATVSEEHRRKNSSESGYSSENDTFSRWSNDSRCANDSPGTSPSNSLRGSDPNIGISRKSIKNFLDTPISVLGLLRRLSSIYDEDLLQPSPLKLKNSEFFV